MKRAISMLIAIVMVFSMIPTTAFAVNENAPVIYFETCVEEEMAIGGTFTVTAYFRSNPGINSIALPLKWNEDVVSFEGFVKDSHGYLDSEVFFRWMPTYENSTAIVTAASDSNVNITGKLFTAKFKIIGSGAPEIGFVESNPDDASKQFQMGNNAGTDLTEAAFTNIDWSAIANLSVAAPETEDSIIPEGAPFTAISTNGSDVISITRITDYDEEDPETGAVGFPFYYAYVPYYHVVIPTDATEVYVTDPNQAVGEDLASGVNVANGLYAAIDNNWEGITQSFEYETNGNDVVVTVPLEMEAIDWNNNVTKVCFITGCEAHADAEEDPVSAAYAGQIAIPSDYGDTYKPTYLLTFEYGTASDDDETGETTYDINVEQTTGGSISVVSVGDENETVITKAKAGDYVLVKVNVTNGYEFRGIQIDGTAVDLQNGCFQMPAKNITVSAVFVQQDQPSTTNTITLEATTAKLEIGANKTLVATVTPADARIVWESSDTAVATVDETGVVTAVAAGSATITATIQGTDCSATCEVEVSDVPRGYTVVMPDDMDAVVDAYIDVPVTVGGATFNAYDMTFQYDHEKLTLISQGTDSTAENYVQGLHVGGAIPVGTIHMEHYGNEQSAGSRAFTLKFQVMQAGNANIQVISAKVGKSEQALQSDASAATLTNPVTQVISSYSVNLPADFTGNPSVASGQSYTFTAKDIHYKYTFNVTIGGTPVENVVTDNLNGTYTITENWINGNVVIEVDKSEGKTYSVNLEGAADLSGENEAQYMATDGYTATLTRVNGYHYKNLVVTIGGKAYTGYQTVEDNKEGKVYYTIPGKDITGDIVFTHTRTDVGDNEVKVNFEGDGAADIASNTATVATLDSPYSFAIDKKPGFNYVVTYRMGADTDYTPMPATEHGYTIATVTGQIWIKIEKVSDLEVTVHEYLKLDGKSVFLITATQTLEAGKILTYDGAHMYQKTYTCVNTTVDESTGESQTSTETKMEWSYLVIVEKGQTFSADDAKAKITDITATAENLDGNYNVNESGIQEGDPVGTVDINDAQLVYDMYMKRYENFYVADNEATVNMPTVRKFLRADINGDKLIDTMDAAAIVAEIISQKNTSL